MPELSKAGVGTARLDSLVLLEDYLGKDRAWLLAHPDTEILAVQVTELKKLLSLRTEHKPMAYIRGHTEFYGRDFVISSAVLEPRPESETMIDLFRSLLADGSLRLKKGYSPKIADVGTGSGALGITAALEVPETSVDLIDIDPETLKIAKMNVDKFTLEVNLIESDLLTNTSLAYDVLLCNLPYVPDDYQINLAASHEPEIAIFGGPDGLDLYRKLFSQVKNLTQQPLYILTESLPPQHHELSKIAAQNGYKLTRENDFIQLFNRTN